MCGMCLGTWDVCGIWTRSIMEVHPRCLLSTVHLLEWVPDTHSRGSRDYCHAISNCTHTHSYKQKPHSYRWPITSVMAHWRTLSSPLPCGDDRPVLLLYTGEAYFTQENIRRGRGVKFNLTPSCPVHVLVNKLELYGGQWQSYQSDDLRESIKRFHCCDFVFRPLFRESSPPWSSTERNDAWSVAQTYVSHRRHFLSSSGSVNGKTKLK